MPRSHQFPQKISMLSNNQAKLAGTVVAYPRLERSRQQSEKLSHSIRLLRQLSTELEFYGCRFSVEKQWAESCTAAHDDGGGL